MGGSRKWLILLGNCEWVAGLDKYLFVLYARRCEGRGASKAGPPSTARSSTQLFIFQLFAEWGCVDPIGSGSREGVRRIPLPMDLGMNQPPPIVVVE